MQMQACIFNKFGKVKNDLKKNVGPRGVMWLVDNRECR